MIEDYTDECTTALTLCPRQLQHQERSLMHVEMTVYVQERMPECLSKYDTYGDGNNPEGRGREVLI